MDYTDYTASAQAETTAVSGLDADPFFTHDWTENRRASRGGSVSLPAVRGAGFAVALPNPPWRAALARRLWSIVRGAGDARPFASSEWTARLGELIALFQQVDASFTRGLPQAFVEVGDETTSEPSLVGVEDERATRAANLNQWFCALYAQAGRTLTRTLLPELQRAGLALHSAAHLDPVRRVTAEQQFLRQIFPLLTPLAVDPAHPFPFIAGGSANLLFQIQTPEQAARGSATLRYARVEIPTNRPALVNLVADVHANAEWVWTADLVRHLSHFLFPGMVVRNSYLFRVLRAASAEGAQPADAPDDDWGRTREGRRRNAPRWQGPPVIRLEVGSDMPECVVQWLAHHVGAPLQGLVRVDHAQEIFGLNGLLPIIDEVAGRGSRLARTRRKRDLAAQISLPQPLEQV